MNIRKQLLLIALLAVFLLTLSNCNFPPVENFLETKAVQETITAKKNFNYEIAETFIGFYNSVPNPEAFFGKPISHAYTNPDNGNLAQYFENMRLETQKDEHDRISIAVSNLGNQLFDPTDKEMLIITEDCTHYGDNTIPVCHEFHKFYDIHNGPVLFGEPISHVFEQNNRYYQYFTNICMVWEPFGNVVSLVPLGETYLTSREPLRYTITDTEFPELMIVEKEQPSELNVLYSVEHPFINTNWEQTVTVFITDELGQPLEGAIVSAWVILPNGHFEIYRPADTNLEGISSFTIPALAGTGVVHNDLIQLRIEVEANGQFGQIIGWFRIWL